MYPTERTELLKHISVQWYNKKGESPKLTGNYSVWEYQSELGYYQWVLQSVTQEGSTNSNGYVSLIASADISRYYPDDYRVEFMMVEMVEPGYTVLSSQNTVSYFTNAAGSFVVIHDVDGNGIKDEWERPLAEKFCPTLILNHPSEHCYPEPVQYLGVDKEDLWIYVYAPNAQLAMDYPNSNQSDFSPDVSEWHAWVIGSGDYASIRFNPPYDYVGTPPGKAHGQYYLRFHYNFAGTLDDPNGWLAYYSYEKQYNEFPHTVYVHLFKKVWSYIEYVVIQYWFFYPFNDFTGNHEGDWEHINLLVTSQNPQEASIYRLDYYFHHYVKMLFYNSPYVQYENNTHPKVFVGGTGTSGLGGGNISGGSYPSPGRWVDINPINEDELFYGNGPIVHYYDFINQPPSENFGLIILPDREDIDYDQHPEMSWFSAKISFGIIDAASPGDWLPIEVGNDAPGGPAYNDGWNEIGAVGIYEGYAGHAHPLPPPQ